MGTPRTGSAEAGDSEEKEKASEGAPENETASGAVPAHQSELLPIGPTVQHQSELLPAPAGRKRLIRRRMAMAKKLPKDTCSRLPLGI